MDSLANPNQDHGNIVERLPDYAIGALDDAELDRISRHLEECPACRLELRQVLQIVGVLSDAPIPDPATREKLLARARGEFATAPVVPASSPAPTPVPAVATAAERLAPLRPWWQRPAPMALTIAAALLLIALGIATLRTGQESSSRDVIASIIADATIHPLTDGELSPPARGVLFAAEDATRAVLLAEGLPSLPTDQRYQVWLFTDDGERASAGFFTADASGRAEVLIETPRPLAAYVAIAVSAEPAAGSESPSSPLALGGWLQQDDQ